MRFRQALPGFLSLLVAAIIAVPALAQQPDQPAATPPAAAHKPRPRDAAPKAAPGAETKPTLLGQYAAWGAYTASPGGKEICFAIAKPTTAETKPPNRPRDQPYIFITTRPADKVTNEVSVAIGYPFKPRSEASAQVGPTTFALYTQGDGAWIKNIAEEAHMVDAMRQGETAVVKGESSHGTLTTDTYSLKGLSEALDRVAKACQ
ncbi:MAG: invasion associated locus B family protein [Xanthobacteraceae bacterium]